MADFISKYTGEEIEARLDKVPELETGKAPLWDSEKQYAKGDFCVHKGYLWVCTAEAGNTGTEPSTNYNVWNVTYSNPNLLDNPWFTVNQRSETEYSGAKYTVDRWLTATEQSKVIINSSGVSLSCSSNYFYFAQRQSQEDAQSTIGKTVTVSALDFDGNIYSGTVKILEDMDMDINVVGIKNDTRINIYKNNQYNDFQFRIIGVTAVGLRAVKMELGEVSTLANDIAPDYATELLKCQRYFEVSKYHVSASKSFAGSGDILGSSYFFKVPKRIYPTITVHNPDNSFCWDTNSNQNIAINTETPNVYNKYMLCPRYTGNFDPAVVYIVTSGDEVYWISADL